MTSDSDSRELSERLEQVSMLRAAKEKRNRRVILAIVAIIVSGITMAIGVNVIGGAEEVSLGVDTAYSYWDSPGFEIGIFITLIGTVMMALSANFLITSWRTSQVQK